MKWNWQTAIKAEQFRPAASATEAADPQSHPEVVFDDPDCGA
jgi:hypothetical protein